MQDGEKIVVKKPVASRPFSNFRSFTELLTGAMHSPSSSSPEKTITIKPKTLRFKPSPNDSASEKVSSMDNASEAAACCLLDKRSVTNPKADTESNVLYKPTAKVVSRTTASLLVNLGNFDDRNQQANTNVKASSQVPERARPNFENNQPTAGHLQNSSSHADLVHIYELSNSMSQSMELDAKAQQSTSSGDRPSYDGYNWRKYGQKQVKGSEYPRSYYKCTHPSCPVKKKVERSLDGQIAEVVYKGEHNHTKPQPPKRLSSGSQAQNLLVSDELGRENCNPLWSNPSFEGNLSEGGGIEKYNELGWSGNPTHQVQVQLSQDPLVPAIPSSTAKHPDSPSTHACKTGSRAASVDRGKLNYKKRKNDNQISGENMAPEGVADPHSVLQASVESDASGDGFHWRKYGQKIVKGNSYPRSYYRCTSPRCNVRKYVERASDDSGSFVTTYEGKHNHEMPTRRVNLVASDPDAASLNNSN